MPSDPKSKVVQKHEALLAANPTYAKAFNLMKIPVGTKITVEFECIDEIDSVAIMALLETKEEFLGCRVIDYKRSDK